MILAQRPAAAAAAAVAAADVAAADVAAAAAAISKMQPLSRNGSGFGGGGHQSCSNI